MAREFHLPGRLLLLASIDSQTEKQLPDSWFFVRNEIGVWRSRETGFCRISTETIHLVRIRSWRPVLRLRGPIARMEILARKSPELIENMRIGYAPGGCLRGWLTQLGYPLPALRQAGLITADGYDAYVHRIVFPRKAISTAAASLPRPRRTASCQAPRVICTPGGKSGITRK
jgi:hypothetical protein